MGLDRVSSVRNRDESVGGSRLERAREGSRALSVVSGSKVVSSGVAFGDRIRQWRGESRLVGVGAEGRDVVESSFAYRWLTSEPDPEVIVIDLRETRAFGPLIRGVDRGVSEFTARSRTSTVVGALGWVGSAIRARPIQVVSAVVLAMVVMSLVLMVRVGSVSQSLLLGQLLVAGLAALGLRSRASLGALLETRVGRGIVAAFEPPEPPERVDDGSRQDAEDSP
ncbi:hypothetical protein [Natronorubrum texcoconense]|uniref:hypothetical protein n=1 Tax=Natronorubrum texcoconense TaxID=1095776 RepID=UPI001FE0B7B0|nr:hypothetical protein [Natronorubrum texcoconense]